MRFIAALIIVFPVLLFSQTKEKEPFVKENFVHLKAGATINRTNFKLFQSLNSDGSDVFTPTKHIYYNPSVDIEFESYFSKYLGISIDLGFLQLRQKYHCTSVTPAPVNYNNTPNMNEPITDGIIISNIPHLNIAPAFYFTKNTRLYAGIGIYKYYYYFDPMQVGNFVFNLNKEDVAIYSNIGFSQSFNLKRYRCSFTINYFGLKNEYDSGLQVAFGLVL
ncbi:MAG: hypothetical protein V4565_05920 [Bacteroidota bacterium]